LAVGIKSLKNIEKRIPQVVEKQFSFFKQDKTNKISVLTNKKPLFHALDKDGDKIGLMLN